MKALVTGATGFLGAHLTRALLQRGHTVRILARSAERAAELRAAGAEVRVADASDERSLQGCAAGMDVVFHLIRSPTSASAEVFERVDVRGTAEMLAEAERAGVRRLVYVSTLAGYPLAQQRDGATIDETAAFDDSGLLGNYVRAKARAEAVVLGAHRKGRIETVIVRLGLVCGVGTSVLPAHVCQPVKPGLVILFGDGRVPLPLTYVDNAVDALILAAEVAGISGESFNIVDDDGLTQRDYLALLRQTANGRPRVLRLPRAAYYALGLVSEIAASARGKEPTTNRYRIRTRLARVRFDCSKAQRMLRWRPRIPLREGLTRAFRVQMGNQSGG
jgi:nucleoside-diphosphate-sugar epimerase